MRETGIVSEVPSITERPLSDRLREHRYRCAQAVVFGLPVVGLALAGEALGEGAGRFGVILQAVMAGWVVSVGATGMVIDAVLRRRVTADALVGVVAVVAFVIAAGRAGVELAGSGRAGGTWVFAGVCVLLAAWTGVWWALLGRRVRCGDG